MSEPFRVLSWGCGTPSTTLAVMSALGELPRLDAVITADTGWERRRTYGARDWYAEWLRERGVRVEIVQGGDVRRDGAEKHVHIPFWTETGGPLKRQCTWEFKVCPIRRRVRELLGYHASKPPAPPPGAVEQWLGFTIEEWERVRDSGVQFIVNRHPLIELKMTRRDCEDWLRDRGLPVPVKSACVCCPYRRAGEWLEMRAEDPAEFADAVAFDEANRHNPLARRAGSTADTLFVWQGLWRDGRYWPKPLGTGDLETAAAREKENGSFQIPMFPCGASCGT